MIVFHGSTSVIKTPDTNHSKRFLDFGMGLYVTSHKDHLLPNCIEAKAQVFHMLL